MITDGKDIFPKIEMDILLMILEKVEKNGCKVCGICFFIKPKPYSAVPEGFQQICEKLRGNIYVSNPYTFKR